MFRAGVPQELLAAGFTPPPSSQPTVAGGKGVDNDINTKKRWVPIPPSLLTWTFGPQGPWHLKPSTFEGSKELHPQSLGRISHPGRCHCGPSAGFSSKSLRTEEGHMPIVMNSNVPLPCDSPASVVQ